MDLKVFKDGLVVEQFELYQILFLELLNKIVTKDVDIFESDKKQLKSVKSDNHNQSTSINETNETTSPKSPNKVNLDNMANPSNLTASSISAIHSVRMLKKNQTCIYVKEEEEEEEDDGGTCVCNNHMHLMDISTGHLILSYMERYRHNVDLLADEWRGLLGYQADDTSTSVATLPSNLHKNRSQHSLPYDKNRVTLNKDHNHKNSDYINASYIVDSNPHRPSYIFTQNPTPSTICDFWQMVWESDSNVIINLTSLSDQSHPYWPETGSCTYHNYEVHLISQHITHPDYIVRNLLVYNLNKRNGNNNKNKNNTNNNSTNYNHEKNGEINKTDENNNHETKYNNNNKTTNKTPNYNTTNNSPNDNYNSTNNNYNSTNNNYNSRTISIFHYYNWPSLHTPSTTSLLTFMRKVNKSCGGSRTMIIHCNDGSDRTGTYALIDNVIKRIISGVKEINMAATLEHLRDQRMGVVKTKDQYEFSLMTVAQHITKSLLQPCACTRE